MAAVAEHLPETPPKPRFRGVSHQVAFFAWLPLALVLALIAPGRDIPEILVYVTAIWGLFGVSALYHRRNWSPIARGWIRRLDHSMIFVAIAGSYTAVVGLALEGDVRRWLLVAAWVGAGLGIASKVLWFDGPAWIRGTPYIVLGWMAVLALPQLAAAMGWIGLGLLVAGGLLYTVGAVVVGRQRPDPRPAVFGYHEIFHAFVIGGAATHFGLVVLLVAT